MQWICERPMLSAPDPTAPLTLSPNQLELLHRRFSESIRAGLVRDGESIKALRTFLTPPTKPPPSVGVWR